MMDEVDDQAVADATRRWVADMVIGLNLCPFARKVIDANRLRYAVTPAVDVDTLLTALEAELKTLIAAPRSEVETTLLIHPRALPTFDEHLDFLPEADRLLRRLGLRGIVQIVGFHPDYRFADVTPDAVENYTNRSPHPMLHLLREDSISEVSGDPAVLAAIPERNIITLRELGLDSLLSRLSAVTEGREQKS